jgi:hypothetical protein
MAGISQLLLIALQWSLSSAAVIQARSPQTSTTYAHSSPAESLAGPLISALKGNYSEANLAAVLPKARLAKVKQLSPVLRPTAKRTVSQYGPYTLVGKEVCKSSSPSNSLIRPASQALIYVPINGSTRTGIHERFDRWHMQELHHLGGEVSVYVRRWQ